MSASTLAPTTDSGGDVAIIVGDSKISGWETVAITRSCELFPNHFIFTLTEPYPNDPSRILVQPGLPCQVLLGDDLIITGYIDRYSALIGPHQHSVEITGRGQCEDLVDCSADLLGPNSPIIGGSIPAQSALDLATKLCAPFGIQAICNLADLGKPLREFQVQIGETPYEIIERVARFTGYLIYEDAFGNLVLDRTGTQPMASGFVQGVNVEQAAISYSTDQRFTAVTVVWSTTANLYEGSGVDPGLRRAPPALDFGLLSLARNRPRIVPSLQTDNTPDFAARLAAWEQSRRIGRSQVLQLTCDTWRDQAGRPWTPNYLVTLDLPALKLVGVSWLIASVTFRKDGTGTHADLTLMPPQAFSVQPAPLNIFDWELGRGTLASPSPAPPT